MTLKEIAAQVGVSVSTVSRVVNQNNPKAASPQIQEKIWEVVRKTGYIPNTAARTLKAGAGEDAGQQARSIACIFGRAADGLADPFFSHLARSIEQEAFKNNFFVKYSFSAMGLTSNHITQHISDILVDGVVILGRTNDDNLFKTISEKYANMVYTGLNPIPAKCDQVICDGYDAACAAVDHLAELGHTKIAYIGEQNKEIRYKAYKDCLEKHGIQPTPAMAVNVPLSPEGGYQGAQKLLANNTGATAVFCANDVTAIGAMKAFKEHALQIPRDISVIGIDDIETAQYISPMLTTIHIPREELGKIAAQTLMQRIQKQHKLPMKITLPFYVVKRESCQKLSHCR